MRHVSKDERIKILQALATAKGDHREAAKNLRIDMNVIAWVDIVENRKFGYTEVGKGPASMWPFIVAIRSVFTSEGWDNSDKAIIDARAKYEKGIVDMATGRDGEYLILYAIPRREVEKKRKPYFSEVQE